MSRKSDSREIIGISLVRNEEHFVAWALMNAIGFCDRVLVLDNGSTDATPEILHAIASRHPKVEIHQIDDAYDTHRYVEPLVGTSTWIFRIDGDEIHDPVGLSRLRKGILAGDFDAYWSISGHMLHVTGVDAERNVAYGYQQPAAPSGISCFNLEAMARWHPGRHERLHGHKRIEFRPGYSPEQTLRIWEREPWSEACLRCLHLCFMPRSSHDVLPRDESEPVGRANPSEIRKSGSRWRQLRNAVMRRLDPGYGVRRNYKLRHYAKGDVTALDISSFGRVTDHHAIAPRCDAAAQVLEQMTGRYADLRS